MNAIIPISSTLLQMVDDQLHNALQGHSCQLDETMTTGQAGIFLEGHVNMTTKHYVVPYGRVLNIQYNIIWQSKRTICTTDKALSTKSKPPPGKQRKVLVCTAPM